MPPPTTAGLSAILAAPGGPQQTLVDDSNVVALLKAVVHVIEDQERALAAQAGELASCRRRLDAADSSRSDILEKVGPPRLPRPLAAPP